MKCNQIDKIIPQLLRREVDSETRLDVIIHLRHCPECRKLYYHYHNIFYSIDRNIVHPAIEIDMSSFDESVRQQIKTVKPLQKKIQLYNLIYAAAAVLFILAVIYSFSHGIFTSTPGLSEKEEITLKEHLEFEDWQSLNSILNDPQKIKIYIDEKIPLFLLREKLIDLQNRGIYSITYTLPTTLNENPRIEIPLDALLVALNHYRQGSAASIRDLSKFKIII